MTKIEIFAKEHFGIELTLQQMKLLRAWSVGASVIMPRQAGVTTAKRVYYAYLQDSVKDDSVKVEEEFE